MGRFGCIPSNCPSVSPVIKGCPHHSCISSVSVAASLIQSDPLSSQLQYGNQSCLILSHQHSLPVDSSSSLVSLRMTVDFFGGGGEEIALNGIIGGDSCLDQYCTVEETHTSHLENGT